MKQQSLKALKHRNNMLELINFDMLPSFDQWALDDPEQNEFYLVYRVGYVLDRADGLGDHTILFANITTEVLVART